MFNSIFVKVFIWITILGALLFFVVFKEIKSVEESNRVYRLEKLAFDRAKIDLEGKGEDVQSVSQYLQIYDDIDPDQKRKVNAALPDHANEIDTEDFLTVLASESGLRDIDANVPIAPSSGSGLQQVNFDVVARGQYNDLLVFLKNLEHSLRIFHITRITTQRQGSSNEVSINADELVINVSGTTYYYLSP